MEGAAAGRVALPPPLADLGETGAVLCWPGAPPGPGQSAGESSACPASRVDQPERRPGVRVGSRPVPASQRVRLADPGSGIVMPAGIRHRWRRLPVAVHLLL